MPTFSRSNGMEGNLIRWSSVKWELTNMESIDMSADEFCLPPKPKNLMFPGLRDFPSVITMCKQFHGRVSVMKSKQLSEELGGQWWDKMSSMGEDPYGIIQLFHH